MGWVLDRVGGGSSWTEVGQREVRGLVQVYAFGNAGTLLYREMFGFWVPDEGCGAEVGLDHTVGRPRPGKGGGLGESNSKVWVYCSPKRWREGQRSLGSGERRILMSLGEGEA